MMCAGARRGAAAVLCALSAVVFLISTQRSPTDYATVLEDASDGSLAREIEQAERLLSPSPRGFGQALKAGQRPIPHVFPAPATSSELAVVDNAAEAERSAIERETRMAAALKDVGPLVRHHAFSDDELRADITRLEGALHSPLKGAKARAEPAKATELKKTFSASAGFKSQLLGSLTAIAKELSDRSQASHVQTAVYEMSNIQQQLRSLRSRIQADRQTKRSLQEEIRNSQKQAAVREASDMRQEAAMRKEISEVLSRVRRNRRAIRGPTAQHHQLSDTQAAGSSGIASAVPHVAVYVEVPPPQVEYVQEPPTQMENVAEQDFAAPPSRTSFPPQLPTPTKVLKQQRASGERGGKGRFDAARKAYDAAVFQLAHGRSTQQVLKMTGPGEAESAVQDRLPVKKDDKKHCLTPNVWINGKCLGDPRGTKDSDAERKQACRGGEQSKSCKSFKQKQARLVTAYNKGLRQSSDFSYAASSGKNKRAHAGRGKGVGSLDYDLKKALGVSGNAGRTSRKSKYAKAGGSSRGAGGSSRGPKSPRTSEKDLKTLEHELTELDPLANSIDPNEFMPTPQRFPHADGADLGDNFISGSSDEHGNDGDGEDHLVLASEASMKMPTELSTFFGKAERPERPMYARKHLKNKDIDRLRRDKGLLKYADNNFAFGRHSPLNKKLRGVLYGSADPVMSDRYGFPSDVMPSTKQYRRQVSPLERNKADTLYHDPLATRLKQRWRKWPEDCKGRDCVWKPDVEDADKECVAPDCSELCKGAACTQDEIPMKVCGPLGCEETTSTIEAADPLLKQMADGGLDGHADPFGVSQVFDDDEEPGEAPALDQALRSHFRVISGEPIGDSVMRGWNMHNGVDFESKDDYDDQRGGEQR